MNVYQTIFSLIWIFVQLRLSSASQILLIGDYYWRDFNGTVPKDALSSGGCETKAYIGQVWTPFGQLVGALKNGCMFIEVATNETVLEFTSGIKILCSQNKNRFVWVLTKRKSKEIKTQVMGGSTVANSMFPFGNIAIARYDTKIIGYRDIIGPRIMHFVLDGDWHSTCIFEELYYKL